MGPFYYMVTSVALEPVLMPLSSFVQSCGVINTLSGAERLKALGT